MEQAFKGRSGLPLAAIAVLAISLSACESKRQQPQGGPASPTGVTRTGAPQPNSAVEDVWYVVSKDGTDLGILELRAGQHGVLSLESDGGEAAELRERWQKLDAADGIAVDMHLPPPDGEGRGPYGSRLFRPKDKDYPMAVKAELDRVGYDVKQVPALAEQQPPEKIELLKIAHKGGAHVGKLAFGEGKPVLTSRRRAWMESF